MSVFSQSARGPASKRFASRLARDCAEHWRSAGRQQCERVSLTGNRCHNRKHRVPGQAQQSNKAEQEEEEEDDGVKR